MNTGAPWPTAELAEARVLGIQAKLHRWAIDDPTRRFDDLFNLVCDPAFLLVGWRRVRGNMGARTAGVDGQTAAYIEWVRGEAAFLAELRADLKARRFAPLPVRERMIPKPGGRKRRRLGIPTVRDRVVQAALKLVLEPIFEADFQPCSYGFRPGRRAHDALAEIHLLASHSYEWVVEGDIEACFDTIDHTALLQRMRRRVGDKRVLGLVRAFCKAGILTEAGQVQDTITGTPQGGILSPLLANIALSVLDEHFAEAWQQTMGTNAQRRTRKARGLARYRLVRYADDFVVMVAGTRADAEALKGEAAAVLAPMGLRLSEAKTRITHIDEGLDFLGYRMQRHQKRGTAKRYVYTYPSKNALQAIKAKVRTISRQNRNQPLAVLLHRLNLALRGWCVYFRHGCSARTFRYLGQFTWERTLKWLRRKHPNATWKQLRRRYLPGWWPTDGSVVLANPEKVTIIRYRYRGAAIPTPWTPQAAGTTR
ncbi:MAG: group II intron reverse transcriptase/maturase [Actinomycetes bacterium]